MMPNSVRIKKSICCECHAVVDGASEANGEHCSPSPGDFSICSYCGSLNVYDDDVILRKPNDDEYFIVATDRNIQLAREMILERIATANYPWEVEALAYDFVDEDTGLPIAMRRQEDFGHWCAYVGVPDSHPWHGRGYDDRAVVFIEGERLPLTEISSVVRCHGGLTYAGKPLWPDENRATHWFGFDCAHAGDLIPGMRGWRRSIPDCKYRSVEYVKSCARQAAIDIASGGRK